MPTQTLINNNTNSRTVRAENNSSLLQQIQNAARKPALGRYFVNRQIFVSEYSTYISTIVNVRTGLNQYLKTDKLLIHLPTVRRHNVMSAPK